MKYLRYAAIAKQPLSNALNIKPKFKTSENHLRLEVSIKYHGEFEINLVATKQGE